MKIETKKVWEKKSLEERGDESLKAKIRKDSRLKMSREIGKFEKRKIASTA